MIVCQCLAISDRDIRAAISWMRAADPDTLITAGKVYRALGKSPDCGGCIALFVETMRQCPEFAVPGTGPAVPVLRRRHQAAQNSQ